MDEIRKESDENEEPEVEGHVANVANSPEDVALGSEFSDDPSVANRGDDDPSVAI